VKGAIGLFEFFVFVIIALVFVWATAPVIGQSSLGWEILYILVALVVIFIGVVRQVRETMGF
jgi:low affinity Fe/Cu permease